MIETIAPESVGLSSSRLHEITTAMQAFVDQGKLAGIATLIARRGKVAHFDCHGMLDLAANKPLQSDSLFRIASLTKPITSVALLMLFEEGRFNLDDAVTKWIPEFKHFKVWKSGAGASIELGALETEITFRHLLTHTSGLGYGWLEGPIEALYGDAKIPDMLGSSELSMAQIVRAVAKLPLVAQPGATWHYSVAHDVIGYLIELISGLPFDVFLCERIFEPLGMVDTGFCVPEAKLVRFGPLYSGPSENGLTVALDVSNSPFVIPETVPSGGGGLVSSMPDYFRFMLMLANGGELDGVRFLGAATVTAMTTNQLVGPTFPVGFGSDHHPAPGLTSGTGYGLGVAVQVDDAPQEGMPAGAFGWFGGTGPVAWIFPREDMIVLAMPQAASYWVPGNTLKKMAYGTIAD